MLIIPQKNDEILNDQLINAVEIHTSKGMGRNGKGRISVKWGVSTQFDTGEICVAEYSSIERAKAEFEAIVTFFETNPNGIYRMSQTDIVD